MKFKFIHGSIRKKLVLIVLFATLPVFVILILNEFEEREMAVETAKSDTEMFLHGFTEIQKRITASTRTLLKTISELPEIKKANIAASEQILATILKANSIYTNAILLDANGDVLAMGRGTNKGFNFQDRKQFRDALTAREFSFGEYVIGKQSNKSIFPFAMPITEDNEVLGVIVIGVDLSHYGDLFVKGNFPEGSFFGICDHTGKRLFRYPKMDKAPVGKDIKQEVFEAARNARTSGTIETEGSDGYQRIIAYEPLLLDATPTPYMYIFMGLDKRQILSQANRSLKNGATTGVVSLCLALLVAWLLAWKSIGANIDRLNIATHQLSKGNQRRKTGVPYSDGEIGHLAESFDKMSELLNKREEDLRNAKEIAESANNSKDEFLANISHEVRTPLNGVMGMLQLLEMTKIDTDQKNYVQIALNSSQNLLRLLNDLLDFIKAGSGKLELITEPFELESLVKQSVDLFKFQLEEKKLDLSLTIDRDTPKWICGDSGRLRQILFNLLGNAIKFTEKGSILIHIERIGKTTETSRILFKISDTGIGIPADKLDMVFDTFTQVDGSFSRKQGGSGLGLSIVKKLTALMKGDCRISSEQDKGTTVEFDIEVIPCPNPNEEERVPDCDVLQKQNLHILVAEDDPINQEIIAEFLNTESYTYQFAKNGYECMDMLRRKQFDMILMDIQMPEMDGLECTQNIRNKQEFQTIKNIPIIAISAHAADFHQSMAYEAGVDAYVTKPFDTNSFFSTIRRLS